MDWLANIVSILPLEKISDAVSQLTIRWSHLVANAPPEMLPLYAYVGFSVIVLLLWLFIVKVLPSPLGGMSWLAVFAVLLTPSTAAGESGDIAPASIGVVYGILMKDPGLAMRSLLPILIVFSFGLVLGFIWQMIKSIVEKSSEKARQQAIAEERANVQLAAANYENLVVSETAVETNATTANSAATTAPSKPLNTQAQPSSTQAQPVSAKPDTTINTNNTKTDRKP